MADDEHEGASIQEQLIEACRRDNTDLLKDLLEDKGDDEISALLNHTTTVMGNHLYHEAASRGNYEIIDLLLDQPDFECDPINRALIGMMLEAGSNPRTKNKGGLTAYQLVDPRNTQLRDLIQQHEYANQNMGDFVQVEDVKPTGKNNSSSSAAAPAVAVESDESDDDAEFSGSDDEERAEWERRRKQKKSKGSKR
ncbi:hypothetical protein PT974_09318 [Cladobotryum mycophilum]|uniref:Ankyrin repeat protein n=1 Tax=Cladobotryum mycophilum TaxID=491253 RepID=A0ABR0SFT8_9HYPO